MIVKTGNGSYLEALDIDRIEAARQAACFGRKIVLYHSTDSTNDIAFEYANKSGNHGLCILAESQHKGRGRRGRTWHSQPGKSILCSILLTKSSVETEMLTLAAAVAIAEAINRCYQLPCRIKWPNDILIQDQKAAGILIEKRQLKSHPCYVIGVGINCNQTTESFADYDLNIPATSLAIQTGKPIDRTGLVCELLNRIEHWLDMNDQSTIIDRWLQLSGMLGRHVTVECDGRKYSGFCRGVDPIKGLILHLDNSLVRMFSAAQTSIVQA